MDRLQCPACGASNPPGAGWCGRCYERFEAAVSQGDLPSGSIRTACPPGAFWDCPVCGESNHLEASECLSCGASVFDSFGVGGGRPSVAPEKALAWSALPGLGLAKSGQGLLGLSIGLLIALSLGAGALFVTEGSAAAGVMLMITAVIIWLVSAHDAYRWARREETAVLLRPRVVTILAGLVIGLMVVAFVVAGERVGRA